MLIASWGAVKTFGSINEYIREEEAAVITVKSPEVSRQSRPASFSQISVICSDGSSSAFWKLASLLTNSGRSLTRKCGVTLRNCSSKWNKQLNKQWDVLFDSKNKEEHNNQNTHSSESKCVHLHKKKEINIKNEERMKEWVFSASNRCKVYYT